VDTSELIIRPMPANRDLVIVGAVAGLTSGLAMALWGMLTSIYHGVGLLSFFEMIGATFMGANAAEGGLGQAAYGFLIHAATSAGLGILFTAFLPQSATRGFAAAAGLGFGMAALLAMTFVVTPIVNPVLRHTVEALPKSWLIQHALFGLTLGLVPLYWRSYSDEGVRVRLPGQGALVVRQRLLPAPRALSTPPRTPSARPVLRRTEILGSRRQRLSHTARPAPS
jgi:hypothetical protein